MKIIKTLSLAITFIYSLSATAAGHMEQTLIEQDEFVFWYNTLAQQASPKLPKISLNNSQKKETKQIAKGISMKVTKASMDNWLGQIDVKCLNVNTETLLDKCMTAMLVAAYATDREINEAKMQEVLMLALENSGSQYLDNSTEMEYNIAFDPNKKQFELNIQPIGGHIVPMGK